MSQSHTPLFSGLVQHSKKNPIQFHIPGHKKGKGIAPEFREFIGDNALSIDLINIGPLDDLHQPKGIIKEAQDLAAEAFGADHTFFSVQGTSGAIMAMIMSVCGPGDKIIVPRNVHKSVMSAIVFSGAIPIFIHPEIDEASRYLTWDHNTILLLEPLKSTLMQKRYLSSIQHTLVFLLI